MNGKEFHTKTAHMNCPRQRVEQEILRRRGRPEVTDLELLLAELK